ncbi:glycosyl transferase [Microbacterium aquimaris]|uniref:glycosyltransferase n=1 Tax=Microbacterium aquimaris TaxID=459816 RepID=UPI002AD35CF6|nr:glycosyltransferase [Microbacterium aquimaris]MDZ8274529.1 glycosyl transferase [Microbacterium aquimaris]
MPSRVHALLVVRPEGRPAAAFHLRRTLAALQEQRRPVDVLTIVVCGDDPAVHELAAGSGAESVITASAGTSFAAATALATHRLDGDAVWLLAQDTAPEPEALTRLAGALELAPSVAFVAPKLVRWDNRSEIVSLGVSMTGTGRSIGLADDELDQGQHDVTHDVLGSDVRGILVRADAWRDLAGLDPALAGADEGLDLAVRARLAGARISLVPTALVAVAGDGVAGLPAPRNGRARRRGARAVRTAQLHRRLAYAPAAAVLPHWLSLIPLALWLSAVFLVRKQPGLVLPQWAAAVVVAVRIPSIARSRSRIRRNRRASWAQIAPLRVTGHQLRQRLDEDRDVVDSAPVREDLRFFSGGGAWLVIGALAVSVAAFPALLAWPVLGGGALEPLRTTVAQLWADAAYGLRPIGWETIGAADPFSALVAVLGSLSPFEPSRALVVLWILALPLAALGGWFAAVRVTDRGALRVMVGTMWALAPMFLVALVDGRPTAVLVHLLLPWLFYAGSIAHRTWVASGVASLLLAAVVACAPSLAPAFAVLWTAAIILSVVMRGGNGVARLIWLVVPTVVMFAPLIIDQVRAGDVFALFADPGVPWAGPQVSADPTGRGLLAAGIPTPDMAGWEGFLPGATIWWVPLLSAPVAVLALFAPLTQRWAAGVTLLVVSALGFGTAFLAVGIVVAFDQALSIAVWPGSGLSLAWIGAVGAAAVSLDAGLAPRLAAARGSLALVATLAVLVLAVPSLTAMARDASNLTNGPESTLPAYVAAEGRDDPNVGTIVLTPQSDGGLSAEVVWGGSETLGGQTTLMSTRTVPSAADRELADVAVDLVTSTADDAVDRLAAHGVGFVLLATPADPEASGARELQLSATTALDQRDGLDPVGDTSKGVLWRVADDINPRADAPLWVAQVAAGVGAAQLLVVVIALLLALPTAASRRGARRTSRIVGPYWQEGT